MALSLEKIDKIVGRETHLKAIDLELAPGSRNVILGRTLAGKTSLLRIMAGLDRPTRGRVLVNEQDVTGTSVRKRNVAMVYQQFINYPSLTVYKNIASPLRLAGLNKKEIDRRVRDTAAMLRIDDLLDRLPAELSGGQQQRIAIARSLVKNADLLLLDEPLVNLDYKLREELREELQDIFKLREAIVVYTTTEPTEALMLGGNIVVMPAGRADGRSLPASGHRARGGNIFRSTNQLCRRQSVTKPGLARGADSIAAKGTSGRACRGKLHFRCPLQPSFPQGVDRF